MKASVRTAFGLGVAFLLLLCIAAVGASASSALDSAWSTPGESHAAQEPTQNQDGDTDPYWHIEVVDFVDTGRFYGSLALDALEHPHISYFNNTYQDLMYAWKEDDTWHTELVDGVGEVGRYNSLALDSAGIPHISYYDSTNDDLKYARYDDVNNRWYSTTVESEGYVGWHTSLALDSAEQPHIAYHSLSSYSLKHAWYDADRWYSETVDIVGSFNTFASLELDSSDRLHISYHDSNLTGLKYAWRDINSSTWTTTTVDLEGNVGLQSSLKLDDAGWPHISYNRSWYTPPYIDQRQLKYACYDGSKWTIDIVDFQYDVRLGSGDSLALDSEGRAHISYHDDTHGDLKYAIRDLETGNWYTETIDAPGHVGTSTSLVLDTSNRRHISYFDEWNGDLKYAWWGTDSPDPLPSAAFTASSPDWLGETTVFTNATTGQAPIEYLWSFGDGHTSILESPTHLYEEPGIYTAILTATNAAGSDVVTDTVVIYGPPSVDFTGHPTEGLKPLIVTFTDTTTTIPPDDPTLIYRWNFGDETTSTQHNPAHAYADAAGVYTVTLQVTNTAGSGILTRPNYITVYEPVHADFAGFPTSGVAPLEVAFANLSTGNYDTCAWEFGDGHNSDACANPTHTYTISDSHTVTLTVSGPGGDDDEVKSAYITVREGYTVYLPLILRNP